MWCDGLVYDLPFRKYTHTHIHPTLLVCPMTIPQAGPVWGAMKTLPGRKGAGMGTLFWLPSNWAHCFVPLGTDKPSRPSILVSGFIQPIIGLGKLRMVGKHGLRHLKVQTKICWTHQFETSVEKLIAFKLFQPWRSNSTCCSTQRAQTSCPRCSSL